MGLPYLIDKLFGPLAATIIACVCLVGGLALLISGHLHRDTDIVPRRTRTRILRFAVVVLLIVGASAALSVVAWRLIQSRTARERAQSPPSAPTPRQEPRPATTPKTPPLRPKPKPGLELRPELEAQFVAATSPGLILFNKSSVVVRDPSYSLVMWNLDKGLPTSLPTVSLTEGGRYLKPGQRMVEPTLDRPEMKPLISEGNRIFGFAYVDCPNCKRARYYWLYIVYGQDSWYSEIPEGTEPNLISMSQRLQDAEWDVDRFMSANSHGPILKPLPTWVFGRRQKGSH